MKPYLLSIILAIVYFIASFLTLPNYGISWDETIHFYRGQAYVRFFLTGKTTYDHLPKTNLQGTRGNPAKVASPRRSFYQNDLYNGEYFLKNDSGHPPLNGELAALSNVIFYQNLGILGDIESHHLFNILASSLLVFVIVFFAIEHFGILAAIISFLVLVTYPLFFAESHFNIKDPPETAFFAATIWTFYKSVKFFDKKWLVLSILFFALAIGTKFNAFFIPVIIVAFLILQNKLNFLSMLKKVRNIPRSYLLLLAFGPLLSAFIFISFWPYLWQNFPHNLLEIFIYYKEIGTNARYQPDTFFISGFNTFPWQWILFTTPPLTLILFILGLISLWIQKGGKKLIGLLLILWFLIPLLRVTLPSSTIYGGIRQVLEFLPAMVLIAGVGGWQVIEWLKGIKILKNWILSLRVFLILLFIWPVLMLIKLHPNENIYFNYLIGGLVGAREQSFPSWGNSFGNAYFQGLKWINENAESGAKLALIQGTSPNAPAIFLRPDIDYKSGNWSGIERNGEYLMELTFNDSARNFNYAWDYVENFLIPVYELKVDGVSVLKIWKNDLKHTKESAKKNEVELLSSKVTKVNDNRILIDLDKEVLVSRVYLFFNPLVGCWKPTGAYVQTSEDGSSWVREKDPIPFRQVRQEENITESQIEYFIAGKKSRFIEFVFENDKACPLNYLSVKVLAFE